MMTKFFSSSFEKLAFLCQLPINPRCKKNHIFLFTIAIIYYADFLPFVSCFRLQKLHHHRHNKHHDRYSLSTRLERMNNRESFITRTCSSRCRKRNTVSLCAYADYDDVDSFYEMDMMATGGQKYEMVPLPDSMIDITCFVGNLDEFVNESDLSDLFQSISKLSSLPACVVRKADYSSLGYGFVAFPSVEEKEKAIIRFKGFKWKGKRIKVELVQENHKAKIGRVKVPESFVTFVMGAARKTRNGQVNTMRRVTIPTIDEYMITNRKNNNKRNNYTGKISKKKKKKNKKNSTVRDLTNERERREYDRAKKKGYLTIDGGRRINKNKKSLTTLEQAHNYNCVQHGKPQIILYKASNGKRHDHILIDLSTLPPIDLSTLPPSSLSLSSAAPPPVLSNVEGNNSHPDAADDDVVVHDLLSSWKQDILQAAIESNMEYLCEDNDDDGSDDETNKNQELNVDTKNVLFSKDDTQHENKDSDCVIENKEGECIINSYISGITPNWELPKEFRRGTFEGDRVHAKAMAKQLASLWKIFEGEDFDDSDDDDDKYYNDIGLFDNDFDDTAINSTNKNKGKQKRSHKPSNTSSMKNNDKHPSDSYKKAKREKKENKKRRQRGGGRSYLSEFINDF